MSTKKDLEPLCQDYAAAHAKLCGQVEQLQHEIAGLKRRHLRAIRPAAAAAAAAKTTILDHLAKNLEIFPPAAKRKSIEFHGVKVGWRRSPGLLKWHNTARVVERIKKLYQDEIGVMIKITELPARATLRKLSPEALRTLGITIEGAGEIPFVASTDDDIDKIVNALLEPAEDDIAGAAE